MMISTQQRPQNLPQNLPQPIVQSSLKAGRIPTNSNYGRQSVQTQSSFQPTSYTPAKSRIGTITFRPIEYRVNQNVKSTDRIDPYCKFKIGWSSVTTPAAKTNGLHPVWNGVPGQAVTLKVKDQDYVKIKLKNKDKFFNNTIGKAKVPLTQIYRAGKSAQWIPLTRRHKQAGQVLVEFVFTPYMTGMY